MINKQERKKIEFLFYDIIQLRRKPEDGMQDLFDFIDTLLSSAYDVGYQDALNQEYDERYTKEELAIENERRIELQEWAEEQE